MEEAVLQEHIHEMRPDMPDMGPETTVTGV